MRLPSRSGGNARLAGPRSRAWRPTCRRALLTNADLEKLVDTTTSGSCSAPASASATSSTPAWRRPTSRRKPRSRPFARAGLTPDDIDLIIVGTATPDMLFPSTACLLQHKIGAHHAWGFDRRRGLLGVHLLAHGRQRRWSPPARSKYALVVGADVMSSIIDYTDRSTCVLFGDGAGAVVLGAGRRRRARHPRLRARDRRQRRPGAVHAGRRQPAAGVARDRRPAAALREAGRPDRVQVRRAQDRRRCATACWSATTSRPPTSTCSCRTRRTAASSRRPPSGSG